VPDPVKRADAQTLIDLMRKASGHEATLWGPSIIGFGSVHYVYETGREGDMPLVGFSPRKAATVLYGVANFDGSQALLAQLGKYSQGKGCLYLKRLSDVNVDVLGKLIEGAVRARAR
jgi:hypothetical protein